MHATPTALACIINATCQPILGYVICAAPRSCCCTCAKALQGLPPEPIPTPKLSNVSSFRSSPPLHVRPPLLRHFMPCCCTCAKAFHLNPYPHPSSAMCPAFAHLVPCTCAHLCCNSSCAKAGYFKDDFIHLFVRKSAKRSPLINRGAQLSNLQQTANEAQPTAHSTSQQHCLDAAQVHKLHCV